MKQTLIVTTLFATFLMSPAMAMEDVDKGKKVFKKCSACHAVGENAKHKIGPVLNNVLGSTAGQAEGFTKYSKAMKTAGEEGLVWNTETMTGFLTNPRKYMKGTKMAFPGLKKEEQIVDLLAYLKEFSPEFSE